MKHINQRWFLACILPFLLISCAGLGGDGRGSAEGQKVAPEEAAPSTGGATEREASLRRLVRSHIEKTGTSDDGGRAAVVRRKPYFYKVYEFYPEGPDAFEVSLRETESRTTPVMANVVARKVRYATRFHRKREEAREDTDLFRDSGIETMSFELRHNQWARVGSLFVSEQTERNVEGQWVPVEQKVQHAPGAEGTDEKGRFGRFWSRLFGS